MIKGVEFCDPEDDTRSQLFGDPAGNTYKVVHGLLKEMAGLFTDEVFNIGCDETSVNGRCTQDSTFAVERKVFQAIATEFGKTPEGWEEALFDAGAATNNTIVNAWARHTAAEITATGRRAVESKDSAFYFTGAAPGGPAGWSRCWYDISTNVPANEMKLLLGGEMSMWSDSYCYVGQCGASGGTPVGHALYPPQQDAAFSQSIGGMIWPRGFVGKSNPCPTFSPIPPIIISLSLSLGLQHDAAVYLYACAFLLSLILLFLLLFTGNHFLKKVRKRFGTTMHRPNLTIRTLLPAFTSFPTRLLRVVRTFARPTARAISCRHAANRTSNQPLPPHQKSAVLSGLRSAIHQIQVRILR